MNVYLLGPNGFIGSNLIEKLSSESSLNIISVSDLDSFLLQKKTIIDSSIFVDCVGVKNLFYNKIEDKEITNSRYKLTIGRYNSLMNICKKSNSTFIFISSGGRIYGKYLDKPWTEKNYLNPIDEYGKVCHILENIILESNGIVIRASNIYGSTKRNAQKQGLITELLYSYKVNEEIQIFNNGNSVRDYLHINDFTKAMKNVVCNIDIIPNILNLSSGVGVSQLEVINLINRILYKHELNLLDDLIRYSSQNLDLIDINIISSQKYVDLFGEINHISLEKGITDMMKKLLIIK